MSDYTGFDVLIDRRDGTLTPVPNALVEVRDVTGEADDPPVITRLDDIEADETGHVAAATVALDAGSVLRFSWHDSTTGLNGHAEAITS